MGKSAATILLGHDRSGKPVSVPLHLLSRHFYVAGKSGSGKSKLLQWIAQQTMAAWPYSRASLIVIDPHANLYDSLIAWAAANGFDNLPIVPIDLRANWICSLNVLRPRPDRDPAPLIHAAVRAILHGWKQSDVTDTPRLAKWLMVLLTTLYDSHCTLLEALDIIRSREIRSAMARHVEDAMAKSVWIASANLKETQFQEELESTMNRLGRFLATRVLRLAFSQSDVSLDMHAALERGDIILAALATEGSRIAEEDAAVVGSLLVNEIWSAAKHRGKRDDGQHRQAIVMIDEFQEYVSPVIAQSLAQLRGMNVGFVMAHQSPQQLLDLGQMGKGVLNAIVSNTLTQVIFQTAHPDDLDLLTPWIFRGEVDANQVKNQPYGTKTLGHDITYMDSTSSSTSRGTSDSTNWSTTEGTSHSAGTSASSTVGVGLTQSREVSRSQGQNASRSEGTSHSHAESVAESAASGITKSTATGNSHQRSASEGESRHMDGEYDDLAKIIGPEPTATFDQAYVDEEEEHRALHRTIDKSASKSESEGNSESSGLATTHSTSTARAHQDGVSQSEALSLGTSTSEGKGRGESHSLSASTGITESESISESIARSEGGGHTESESTSEGVSRSPMLLPILGQEALPPQFRATDEQLFIFSQFLASQPDRHAVVRTGTTPPVSITTPTVEPAHISTKGARAWAAMKLKRLPFALTFDEATRRLAERRKLFEAKYLGIGSTGEPTSIVRRIKE